MPQLRPRAEDLRRLLLLVALAVLAGLVTDALRAERVFFARQVPVLRSVPSNP